MDHVEAEGHSIDDAIAHALQRLGVTRDRVDIEIVSNATRGLFGFGGKRAKVRATLRRPIALATTPADGHGAGVPPRRPPTSADHGAGVPPRRPPTSADPGAGVPPRRPPTTDPSETKPANARSRDPERTRARRQPRPGRERSAARRERPAPAAPAPRPPEAVVERARAALQEIVRLTGVEASVAVAEDTEIVRLVIEGDPSGVLIGRRGQTLDAIEYLINRIASHDEEDGVARLAVDSQDYRARRRQSLEAMAHRFAERARRRGKPVTLNPMSPRDRRIIHLTLQGDPTLNTRSAGTGYYRKLVIVPEGARRPR